MEFKNLELSDKELFESYAAGFGLGWEYNFATIYCWDITDGRKIAEEDNILYLAGTYKDKTYFLPPYVKDKSDFKKGIDRIVELSKETGIKLQIRGLQKEQTELLDKDKYLISTDRDDSDYIYKSDDLKYLSGKAFHSKRNFVTRFEKENPEFCFCEYTDNEFDAFIKLYDNWQKESPHSTSETEKCAIIRALKNFKELDLRIGLLKVDGKIRGYSISSFNPDGTAHTGFEKADTRYTGIYQALNKYSANKFFDDGILVNRQDDMGIEGLRKAKLSYSPVMLIDKYKVEEK